jgi:hypothetical protein
MISPGSKVNIAPGSKVNLHIIPCKDITAGIIFCSASKYVNSSL